MKTFYRWNSFYNLEYIIYTTNMDDYNMNTNFNAQYYKVNGYRN